MDDVYRNKRVASGRMNNGGMPKGGRYGLKVSEGCPLSPRELEALDLLSRGLVYKQIAAEMNLSVSTIRTHLHNLYGKIGVIDRAQAVILAWERGWLSAERIEDEEALPAPADRRLPNKRTITQPLSLDALSRGEKWLKENVEIWPRPTGDFSVSIYGAE